MDTGRISLPSIDSLLNTTSQLNYLQAPSPPLSTPDGNMDIHSSSIYSQQDQTQQPSLPYSTLRKGHSRSHSMDINLTYSTSPSSPQQQQPSSFTGHPPQSTTGLGPSVSPSHKRSTRMSPSLPAPVLQQGSSTTKKDIYHHDPRQYRRHPHPHQQHHRSISYTMGMNHNTIGNNNNSLGDTPPRKYICPHCTKSFSRPSSLRTHIFSHSGEKPFACPYHGCNRSFSVQSNMRRHIRVHYSASLAPPT
ncbi:unnamed protein product [Absidia cylindrospora]